MKILEKKYPMGSLPGQKTPGRYIDKILNENIRILAKNIIRDMTYLGIITSSTLEVGTGKSVFAQQLCESYLSAVNEYHKFDLELTMNNLVFRPKDIIERSFKVPRYSVVICDEWEDAHYWSELGLSLRQFFRKCRQLNLLILIIIPNFFQLPMSYAISRSVFLIDVRFSGQFDRGFFSFYNFQKKKVLYVKGRKTQDYNVVKPNFIGRFADGYVVNEKEYRKAKLDDMINQERLEKKPMTEREIGVRFFKKVHDALPEMTIKRLANAFGFTERTGNRYLKDSQEQDTDQPTDIINNLINHDMIPDVPQDDVVIKAPQKEPNGMLLH